MNNTNRTHEFVDLLAKLEADKGVLFDFTNNEKIKETGFAIEGKQVNGYVQGNNISINIDSTSALNKVVGHEITHVLEGTELYNELANAIKEFATAKGEYDSKLQSITKLYEGVENANIENELVAELVGEYLFSDPEFVKRLSTEQPTLFKKIFDEIKYLCKVATAGSKEARQLEKVKKTFEEAYRQKNNTATDDGVKYSIEKLDDGKQYVKADRQVFSGNDPKQWGEQVTDYINDTIRHGKDVVVYAQDGDALTITENTAGKAAFRNDVKLQDGSSRPMTDEEYAVKLRAESHIDEISQVSRRGNKTVPDYKRHAFAKDGFNYRTAYFMDADGKYYRLTLSVGKNGVINTVYNVGKIKEEGEYSLRGSKPVTDETATMRSPSSNNSVSQENTTVNNNSMQDKGKYSLSNANDDIGPVRAHNNVYGEDIKLESASAEDIAPGTATTENSIINGDEPIKVTQSAETIQSSTHEDLVNQMSDIMDESYISLEEFTNSNSSVWKNVDYNDETTKINIMREVHQNMVDDGIVVEIADDVKETVAESYPDLRSMKKKDRTPILKEAINKLKSNLRSFLSDFKNQSFEFEVSGKVLEAKLYNTGINEVLEKITQDKAEMLYSTKEIFRNARYLYSTPDYDGDPNVYRWNYFYTPVKIGDDTVGVRIAVRDTATPQESQIYNWGIKKDTSLDGVGRGTNDRISHDVSSDVSTDIIPNDEQNVNTDETLPDYFVDSENKQETQLTRKVQFFYHVLTFSICTGLKE